MLIDINYIHRGAGFSQAKGENKETPPSTDGRLWPPNSERDRIRQMDRNENLYAGNLNVLFPKQGGTTAFGQSVPDDPLAGKVRIKSNFFRRVSRFWRNTLFAVPPVLDYEDDNPRVLEYFRMLQPSLMSSCKEAAVYASKFGVGILINRVAGMIESVDPRFWYPVVEAFDNNIIVGHILAYPYDKDPERRLYTADRLRVYQFYPEGKCVESLFNYSTTSIGAQIGASTESMCGIPAIAPVRFNYSGNLYGESDYLDMEDQVREFIRRQSTMSYSLDKHNDPHLAVPEGSLQAGANGKVQVDANGMVIPVPEGAENPEYIVWDPKYDAHNEQIKRMRDEILTMAGISPMLFDRDMKTGAIPSGAALRRMATVTVQRLLDIRQEFEHAIKQALVGAVELNGRQGGEKVPIDAAKIKVIWPQPLSIGGMDESEAEIALVEAGLVDPLDAIQRVNMVNRIEAQKIHDEAEARKAAAMPDKEPEPSGQ